MNNLEMSAEANTDRQLVCGYPKTGRTWLRYMLGVALSEEFELGIAVDLNNVYSLVPNESTTRIDGQPDFAYRGQIPQIEMSHRLYDEEEYSGARIMFTTRDPRDIMVSHWLHDSLQVKIFDGSLSEYVRTPERGIAAFLRHLESWSPHLSDQQVVSYEAMRREPVSTVHYILESLGVSVSLESVEKAVAEGEISRMRNLEVKNGIAGHNYDRTNPEARRVRAGKVGGFINYLTEPDLEYIDAQIALSDERTRSIVSITPYGDS